MSHRISTDADILCAVLDKGPQTTDVLIREAGRSKSTVYRRLVALERIGLLERTEKYGATWTIGERVLLGVERLWPHRRAE